MDFEDVYQNVERRDIESTTGAQTQGHGWDEEKDLKHRGSRYLVLISVGLGLICVLLLVFIILLNITITAERDMTKSYKNTVEELNQTINSLHDNNTDLKTEKHQLQNNFNSLNKKNLVLETRVNGLTAEKDQLQRDFDSLNKKGPVCFFLSTESKNWSDSRQYCRDRGADLVIINTEEKQRFISSLVSERVWIGLSDREKEGVMKWVDNSPLKRGFWFKGQPNDSGNQDCIELNYERGNTGWSPLKSWNDLSCSNKKKGICEK
ncbi:CD209 antigen-like [Carassius auratus]|uniref:CD209 antigen-like n=1 Tax=Carassius auratus TaxID=7957 RepID=A0A6P6Q7M7_CARAU|nr:CD209 antigen-like [Carassius auratus]